MSEVAMLVRRARLRQGITREQLAVRVGRPPAFIADVEQDRIEPDLRELSQLLLVCGLILEHADASPPCVRPMVPDVDVAEIEHSRSLDFDERVRSALAWNGFADRIYRDGVRSVTDDDS